MSGELPRVRCDDPSTWRHKGEKIDLPRLLQLIEENGGPEGLDLHGADLSDLDARPEVLRAYVEAYAQEHAADRTPPWLRRWSWEVISIDLSHAHLENADLLSAHLENAGLAWAHLRDADLRMAHLQSANLARARLQNALLAFAHLQNARLWRADLQGVIWYESYLDRTRMQRQQLGPAIGEELAARGRHAPRDRFHSLGTFHHAKEAYLTLKTNFDSIGRYEDASWAYVKEQQMEKAMHFPTTAGHRWIRRQLRIGARHWRKKNPSRLRRFLRATILARLRWTWLHLLLFVGLRPTDFNRATAELTQERAEEEHIDRPRWLRNWFYEGTCGYGENPWRPVIWAAVVVLLFTVIYAVAGNIATGDVGAEQGDPTHNPITALVHSISAFATIGFNTLEPQGWGARLLTAVEAMFGIGLFALFVFTLGNRMRRS